MCWLNWGFWHRFLFGVLLIEMEPFKVFYKASSEFPRAWRLLRIILKIWLWTTHIIWLIIYRNLLESTFFVNNSEQVFTNWYQRCCRQTENQSCGTSNIRQKFKTGVFGLLRFSFVTVPFRPDPRTRTLSEPFLFVVYDNPVSLVHQNRTHPSFIWIVAQMVMIFRV